MLSLDCFDERSPMTRQRTTVLPAITRGLIDPSVIPSLSIS